jgi:hypothetical protein
LLAQKFEQMISIRDKVDQLELVVSLQRPFNRPSQLLTGRAGTTTENHPTSDPSLVICLLTSDTMPMIIVSYWLYRTTGHSAYHQSRMRIFSLSSISTLQLGNQADGRRSPKIRSGSWLVLMPDTVLQEDTVHQLIAISYVPPVISTSE